MKSTKPCRISVITPSFNQCHYLNRTLNSVLSQRDHIHEYLVYDAESTDGSQELLLDYESRLDHCVIEKDEGQADALQKGFKAASGDVLCWINSDDFFLPGALKQVKDCFDAHPEIDVVTGYLILVDESDRILSLPRVPGGDTFTSRLGHLQVSQQSTFFRKRLYEDVGGLDPLLHCTMDYDLWARFFLHRARWISLPLHLAAFRQHSEAKGSGNDWWERYQDEKELVRNRYPEVFGRRSQMYIARELNRLQRLFSSDYYRSVWETRKYRGYHVDEVFSFRANGEATR